MAVGKKRAKLERTEQSWKEPSEVGKFLLKLESFAEVEKFRCCWKVLAEVTDFQTSLVTFQLQPELSKFSSKFPTSIGSFQLQTFQLKTFKLLVLSNCPFQLHVSRELKAGGFLNFQIF